MAISDSCLGHVKVEVGTEPVIVPRKQLGRTNAFPPAPKEGFPNIVGCVLSIKEVGKHHGVKLQMKFSLSL